MSENDGNMPHRLIDTYTRLSEADVVCFAKDVAPRLHAVMASLKDQKFIGHTFRSECPDCTEESPAGNGFADSALFKHWAQDYKAVMARRTRLGNVNAEYFLMKHLVMEYEREGGEHITQIAMERGAQINKQEREEQFRHTFLIATAEKVVAIQSEWALKKLFSNAHGRLEDIRNDLRRRDISTSEVMTDPQKCIADNRASLQKINGGNVIQPYEPVYY